MRTARRITAPHECERCGKKDIGDERYGILPEPLSRSSDGLYWCAEHEMQRELWEWGARHQWRELSNGHYAIAQGQRYWKIVVGIGKDEAVVELACYAYALERDELAS